MANGNLATKGTDIPSEKPQTNAYKPDASHTLREQYFECLAAGQTQCTYKPADRTATSSPNGSLELTNPYNKPEQSVTVPTPVDSTKVLPRSNWTVAINLTTTLDVDANPHSRDQSSVPDGARLKTAQLLEMAESTKGKPVTLVVQNAERDPNFRPSKIEDKNTPPTKDGAGGNNGYLLHTYLIHDGKIDELPARPSAGIAADTQALLATAGKQAPSARLAFISQSHGGGPDGIEGDTGSATLDQVNAAIKNGLHGSGHEKLDVLDFDACSMGNSKVLTSLAGSADQIIASTQTESAGSSGADGQNTAAMVQALLNKPDMTPTQLAAETIKIADRGLNDDNLPGNDGRRRSGTDTLSQYDASKVNQFNSDVSALGNALNSAWSNDHNRSAIRTAIQDTPFSTTEIGHVADQPGTEVRDAKTFANNLLQDIDKGTISDPDGALRKATEAVLNSRASMVANYHGNAQGGYDRQGGISLFMPGNEFFDNQSRANENNSLVDLSHLDSRGKTGNIGAKDMVLSDVDSATREIKRALGEQTSAGLASLQGAREALAHANTQSEYKKALDNLAQESQRLINSDLGRKYSDTLTQRMMRNTQRVMREQEDPSVTGWNNFLATLQSDAPQTYHN